MFRYTYLLTWRFGSGGGVGRYGSFLHGSIPFVRQLEFLLYLQA